jgi:AcrR family transcriptional regulator
MLLAVMRRRGEQLAAAPLTAAWDELVEVGYAHLTMKSVAKRARTGVQVLYRRWRNKDELVLAALQHYRDLHPAEVRDTGSLRGDLIAYLTAASKARVRFFAIAAAAAYSGLLADTGLTPAQVRARAMGNEPEVRPSYQRAADRGELDLARTSASLLAMPFELVRHDLLLHLAPVKPARIRAIVDELFLPLLTRAR